MAIYGFYPILWLGWGRARNIMDQTTGELEILGLPRKESAQRRQKRGIKLLNLVRNSRRKRKENQKKKNSNRRKE